MSYAIFASAAPRSKTSLGARAGAERIPKGERYPNALTAYQLFQQMGNAGLILRKIVIGILGFRLRFRYAFRVEEKQPAGKQTSQF
jgi:hypothetical protein